MAPAHQFRTLPATIESFGIAMDFLSRHQPFAGVATGVFSQVVRRQVFRGEHVVAWNGTGLAGYAGWLPTSERGARAWLAGRGELLPVDENADAVALTTVATEDSALVLPLMRAARARNPGRRIFFKRDYADARRPARKAAVLNRTAAGQQRPSIADDPCQFLFALAQTQPGETVRLPIGDEAALIVQDPQIAARLLTERASAYAKNFASFTPLFGASRLTLDGEAWRRSQKLTQPAIAPHDVPRAEAILIRRYSELTAALPDLSRDGDGIDRALDRATIGTLTELAFSTGLASLGDGFRDDLRVVIRYCARHAWDLPGVPVIADAEGFATATAATSRIRAAVDGMVAERLAETALKRDALAMLLAEADAVSRTEEAPVDIVGEIVTLIVAGSDTTAAALGWALAILAEHGAFQDALRQEVVAATGPRQPALADADRVPSLRPFLEETLRMFPPVAFLSRVALERDEVDGHTVEPGDRVLISIIGIHQNPVAWESPREFRLERYMTDGAGKAQRRSVFLPFSAGPRICGGARFAMMELSLALMAILQRCRLDLAKPLPLAFEWGASMRRRGGQRVRVTAI